MNGNDHLAALAMVIARQELELARLGQEIGRLKSAAQTHVDVGSVDGAS